MVAGREEDERNVRENKIGDREKRKTARERERERERERGERGLSLSSAKTAKWMRLVRKLGVPGRT